MGRSQDRSKGQNGVGTTEQPHLSTLGPRVNEDKMKIVTDHGWPVASDGTDGNAFKAFKNERDYIARGPSHKTTTAAMDWAIREIERLRGHLSAAGINLTTAGIIARDRAAAGRAQAVCRNLVMARSVSRRQGR